MNRKKIKKHIMYTAVVFFALLTAYIIVYAYYHQGDSSLVYIIFNSYALVAVVIAFCFVLYWQHVTKRQKIVTKLRLERFVKNIHSPAMLWSSDLGTVILNEKLLEITELTARENFDAKFVVPWIFGRKEIQEEDIRNILLAKDKEYSFIAQSGEPHDMIWNTSGMESDDDKTWYLSIGQDLSHIRKMESELQTYARRLAASEGKHNLTMELSDIGLLLIEQGSKVMLASEKLQAMLGLSSKSLTAEELQKRVYPPDKPLLDQYTQLVRNRMGDFLTKDSTVLEIRLCSANGQYRWYSYRFKARQNAETGRLVLGGSVMDITQQKEKDEKIQQIAYVDNITGIPNRNKLMLMGMDLYQCTAELHCSYWVIVLDIDHFHLINDTCGYAAGNELLKAFAESMNKQVSAGGFGARISGDNFAMILRDSGDEGLPARIVGRIQRSLATQAVGALANHKLGCSAGYARMPADGASFEEVLERAEFALSAGRKTPGSIERYTAAMHDSIIQENLMEQQLTAAIMNNQLMLYYQPKVSVQTGEVVGLEALVRWNHPSGEIIPPVRFIPIAEKSHLITQITRFVMYEACRQASLWQQMGLPKIVMSINFTSMDFYQENVCEQIKKALEKNNLDPSYLEIELTESMALKDVDMTISLMNEMRRLGIQLAMDDFGTGYSSLSYIQRLPFTMIKLDRSFVIRMEEDPVVQEIIHSVIRIAKAKNIRTIAEGVELPSQAKQLRLAGCDLIQGYLYGRPMTALETEQFIRQNMREKHVY